MPYVIVPKGQPDAWLYLQALPFNLSRVTQEKWWAELSYIRANLPNIRCSVCARKICDLPFNRMFAYSDNQCEECITKIQQAYEMGATLPCAATYDFRLDAVAAFNPKTEEIAFRPTASELYEWASRMETNFDNGTFVRVPWNTSPQYERHYAHIPYAPADKIGMVAYYRDEEAGITNKLTYVKPGRYLTEFYPTLAPDILAAYIAAVAAATTAKYSVATSPEDIAAVYNTAAGPDSCMRRKSVADYDWQTLLDTGRMPCHPCAIYGNSDLALAYTGPLTSVSQRAIIWPEKKRYIRIYGSGPLKHLLHRDGYECATFKGARIRHVTFKDSVSGKTATVTPYVDRLRPGYVVGSTFAADSADISEDGHWLVLRADEHGDISLAETRGHNSDRIIADVEGLFECNGCGGSFSEDDACNGDYCRECWHERYFECDHCGHEYSREENFTVSGVCTHCLYCESCIDEHYTRSCTVTGCDATWVTVSQNNAERNERARLGTTSMCPAHHLAARQEHERAQAAAQQAEEIRLSEEANPPANPSDLFEVQIARHQAFLTTDEYRRRRPNNWYAVQQMDQSLTATHADAFDLLQRMRRFHPNETYRLVNISLASAIAESGV